MQLIWNFKRNLGYIYIYIYIEDEMLKLILQKDTKLRYYLPIWNKLKERTIVLWFLCWSVLGLISLALMEPKCTVAVELYYQYREETCMSCLIFKALQDDFELVRAFHSLSYFLSFCWWCFIWVDGRRNMKGHYYSQENGRWVCNYCQCQTTF